MPTFDVVPSEDAYVTFHLSPQIVLALYDTIPIVVKAKPRIEVNFEQATDDAAFGDAASDCDWTYVCSCLSIHFSNSST